MAILQKMAGHKASVCAAYGKGRLRLPADRRASDIAQSDCLTERRCI